MLSKRSRSKSSRWQSREVSSLQSRSKRKKRGRSSNKLSLKRNRPKLSRRLRMILCRSILHLPSNNRSLRRMRQFRKLFLRQKQHRKKKRNISLKLQKRQRFFNRRNLKRRQFNPHIKKQFNLPLLKHRLSTKISREEL